MKYAPSAAAATHCHSDGKRRLPSAAIKFLMEFAHPVDETFSNLKPCIFGAPPCLLQEVEGPYYYAKEAMQESLDSVFYMSNILETGLNRDTLSILIALCDMGLDAESLAAIVKELRRESSASSSSASAT